MTKYDDRVRETSQSTGTGNLTLDAAAVASYRKIDTAFGNDADDGAGPDRDFYYTIRHATDNTWEVGIGHLLTATTMSRDTVLLNSSETTAKINFAAGGVEITNSPLKDTLENLEVTTLTASGTISADNAAGPAVLNEAATSTNPTLIPNRADPDTGVGWDSADVLAFVTNGTLRAQLSASGLTFQTATVRSSTGDGPSLQNEPASSTNPTVVPNRSDVNTGVGAISNNLYLIAGSTSVADMDNSTFVLRKRLRNTATDSITAGSVQTQAGATALTTYINRITVSGTNGDGVKLPTALVGVEVLVMNDDAAQTIQIWPNTSDAIDGGAVDAVDPNALAAGASRLYVALDSTNWYTANPTG